MNTNRKIRWPSLLAGGQIVIALGLALLLCAAARAQRTATAEATVVNGFVVGATVTDGGAGYSTAPDVTIVGGGGSGATAKAIVSGDAVSLIIVLTAGSGYATLPDILIGPPDLMTSILALKIVPQLTIYGEVGSTGQVQWVNAFGDTNAWVVLTNVVLPSNPFAFYDTISPPGIQRFYRAVVQSKSHPTAPPGFVWLPAGRFTMGSPASEQDRRGDEGPQTVVTLSSGFFLCSHEATQREYLAVMGNNPSYFLGDLNRPVEQVTWSDATNYCGRLTEQERVAGRLPAGWAYRLPTEAEWEYAARAGTTTRFSFGDDPSYTKLGEYSWYGANSGGTTHPVAAKRPNRLGLYDMPGNVSEWCLDWYAFALPGGGVFDPAGPSTGSLRVIRGGWWSSYDRSCRAADRDSYGSLDNLPGSDLPGATGATGVGFRPVLAASQP